MTLTPEEHLLIACSRLDLEQEHRDLVVVTCTQHEVDWNVVCHSAMEHSVAPLVYRNLLRCGPIAGLMPEQVVADFRNLARHTALRNVCVTRWLARAAAFFRGRAHELLLLKHAALNARLSVLFDLTMSGDVDCVVRPQVERAAAGCSGYVWPAYRKRDATWETIAACPAPEWEGWPDLGIEVDNRLHHDVLWCGTLDLDFGRVWRRAEGFAVGVETVYAPDLPDMILIACVNVVRKPCVSLRGLVELRELVRLAGAAGQEELVRRARDVRCEALVYTALYTAAIVLGDDLSKWGLEAIAPGAFRRRVVSWLGRHASPCAGIAPRTGRTSRSSRRRLTDVARRIVAMNGRQLMRYAAVVIRSQIGRTASTRSRGGIANSPGATS